MIFDYIIIGGGVIGCSILHNLTKHNKSCVLLEKGCDVAVGTSKANSGIAHAGFDAKIGSLKAKLNVLGAKILPDLCKELGVEYKNNGAVVIGNDKSVVEELYERGLKNGVEGLKVLDRAELLKLLPAISENITCGLYATTSGIVSPYGLTIALAEHSKINGAEILLNFDMTSFNQTNDCYEISDGINVVRGKKIIVCVGGNHNEVASILGTTKYDIKYRRGEYYLLDKNAMDISNLTIFPLPSKSSKGVLISPTTSGNIIVGPTSILCDSSLTETTAEGLKEIAEKANEMLNNVNLKKNIRVFAGVRTLVGDDFVIEKDKINPDVINVTGICSPGLTASYAIGQYVLDLLGISGEEKEMKKLPKNVKVSTLSKEELNELIKSDSRYGKIVCRCECVTEKEIIDAINSPLHPRSIDAIKRRTRAGMGRCQGGFCMTKIMELISKEYNIPIDEVIKENSQSKIIVGDIR